MERSVEESISSRPSQIARARMNPLSHSEDSLLLATFYRVFPPQKEWTSCSDQIVTLSLFFTGDISSEDCASRFATPAYLRGLYDENDDLCAEIRERYLELVQLVRTRADLIEGGGNFDPRVEPTYTACRLTDTGIRRVAQRVVDFPVQPFFPRWPDERSIDELLEYEE